MQIKAGKLRKEGGCTHGVHRLRFEAELESNRRCRVYNELSPGDLLGAPKDNYYFKSDVFSRFYHYAESYTRVKTEEHFPPCIEDQQLGRLAKFN